MVLRILGSLLFLSAALFFLFGAWMSQNPDFYRDSLENSRVILADMRLLGEKASAFEGNTGRFPTVAELQDRVDPMALQWIGPQRWGRVRNDWKLSGAISIASPQETCALGEETRLSKDALRYYRLCYWRGEWFEEYVPATGEHSLPTSLEDYLASPWQTAAIAMLGLGLLACAYVLVFRRRRLKAAR
ncbi:hypothetical protein [Porphyrobacter sp. LM 6]|uniref:hypothetical protein n=1 Tax=Porphyrobacter sp. LM 6 TaxID=1896196 RepID=UPI000863BF4F|nr:hypothetical protein [Porphyrobacter sp. LM 6]AOL94365.1 hypothetical protein BG023_111432 [Porphyrobacter sp. LM 6]